MKISVTGTAFTSYDVKLNNKTEKDIKNEKISFDETLEKTNQNEKVTYQTTNSLSKDSSRVLFKDPTNDKFVLVSLENQTIEKLKDNFGSDSIYKKEDGSIRLKGKAEAFVSGWFADIAYKRNFLNADENKDGVLEEKEYLSTYNAFSIRGKDTFARDDIYVHEEVMNEGVYGMYNSVDDTIYRTGVNVKSLDDELNHTIDIDKDFNGKVSLKEAYEGDSSIKEKVRKNIEDFYSNPEHLLNLPFNKFFSDAINFLLDTLTDVEKNKDGSILIDKNKWDQLKLKHNIQIDETVDQFLKRTKEINKTKEIYS